MFQSSAPAGGDNRIGLGLSLTRSAGSMKGEEAWALDNYLYPSLRLTFGRSPTGPGGQRRRLIIEAVAMELTGATIRGTHKEQLAVDMAAAVRGISFIFYSGYLGARLTESLSLLAGPGFSICGISADYSGYLYYACGIAEDPAEEFFAGLPIFADICLVHSISRNFRLTCLGRIGLRTYGGRPFGGAMCGLREKHFPCINTGVSLSAAVEWSFGFDPN